MHVARVAGVLFVILVLVFATLVPAAGLAQEDPPTDASPLYLPALLNDNHAVEQSVDTPEPDTLVVDEISAAEQAATVAFWTRERMLQATVLDQISASPEQAAAIEAATEGTPPGTPGRIPGRVPDRQSSVLARELYADEWARIAEEEKVFEETALLDGGGSGISGRDDAGVQPAAELGADAWSSAPPFVSYYINDATNTWKSYPWTTMGRLFFKIPTLPGTYACSGGVAYGRAVWTAAHCLYTHGKGWSYNLYFVPAYRNGSYPYGSFTVKSRTALSGWVYDSNLAYDIGMVAVNDISRKKISQWVGYLGFMYNYPGTQLFHAFGYAGNYSSGRYLVTCASSTYVRDTLPGPAPIGIGCDMGSGASGGPWLVTYAPFKGGSTNYVNSLNAYNYADRPLETFGPYFGDGAKQLYDWGVAQ
jgi:V8-like Glu-specific endopeptidase